MKILWLSWKDIENPKAGGAESISNVLAARLVKDGHEVIMISSGFLGCERKSKINGYKVIRLGNKITVYLQAYRYFKKKLSDWPDLVVEEVNTIPFFSNLYCKNKKRILFFHQLCREVWFYQMLFPFSLLGFLAEPILLRILRKEKVITVSNSTKNDLMRFKFKPENIHIIREGIEIAPLDQIDYAKKFKEPTVLCFGDIRPMKRTKHVLKAFEIANTDIPTLNLIIAGGADNFYARSFLRQIKKTKYKKRVQYFGRVGLTKKMELLARAHVICLASVKEGWGLVVTEANSQGTVAVAYDADGLRDSVIDGVTGVLCVRNNPENMASQILNVFRDQKKYRILAEKALKFSREFNYDNTYKDFWNIISKL